MAVTSQRGLRSRVLVRAMVAALVVLGVAAPGGCGGSKTAGVAPVGTGGSTPVTRDGTGGAGPTDAADDTAPAGPFIIIEEDATGFDAVDGKVYPRQGSTSITGYSGTGFADGDPGVGKTISWSVKAASAGTYPLSWGYAFGGAPENLRDARLVVNGVPLPDPVIFAFTTAWTSWRETPARPVSLPAGPSFIQLQALNPSGLANIDYLKIYGEGITPDTPSFSLTVAASDPAAGSVGFTPAMSFYPYGAMVTVTATANPGYFFQSWTGDAPAATATHTFAMVRNTRLEARFLPTGTSQDRALVGYAAVQDDAGTPYLLNGGSLGPSVTATTLDQLKIFLGSPDPYVVSFAGLIEGADLIRVASNKTLLGVGDSAHLMGIELQINGARNVIIRNVAVSHIIADGSGPANDAIEITGGAKNIWIDHCELYSDLDHDKDYYDGLLDIKNESSFITVSWSNIHDHFKASLISSGDEQLSDTVIRATYHHNYFHDCGSRLPSIRFGRAHLFANYYRNNATGSCVDSRMGAVVRVENNFFETSKNTIGWFEGPATGAWDVANNSFLNCTGAQPTTSTGQLTPPYLYTAEDPAGLPVAIPAGAGVGKL
jgi:pectate lyase